MPLRKKQFGLERDYSSEDVVDQDEFEQIIRSLRKEYTEDDDKIVVDVISSDSTDSSLENLIIKLGHEQAEEERRKTMMRLESEAYDGESLKLEEEEEEEIDIEAEAAERAFFNSIYIKDEEEETDKPLPPGVEVEYRTNKLDSLDNYSKVEVYASDCFNKRFLIEETNEKEFDEKLRVIGMDEKSDMGMPSIAEYKSVHEIMEENLMTFHMDGPTRRIAIIFSFDPRPDPISVPFRDFMKKERKKFPRLTGALLYYEEYGINIVEGSEYVLLMHFQKFLESDLFKELKFCKVLAVEELESIRSYFTYSCWTGTPPQYTDDDINFADCSADGFKECLGRISRGFRFFLDFSTKATSKTSKDRILPKRISLELPPTNYIKFVVESQGLRNIRPWFNNLTRVPDDVDGSEFVWPIRSEEVPVHILHPAPDEDENIRDALLALRAAPIDVSKKKKEHDEEEKDKKEEGK